MNKTDFAAMLDGREYREELEKHEERTAKENGLIVIFGASDLVELRGVIDDELGAWNGLDFSVFKNRDGDYCFPDEEEMEILSKYDVKRSAAIQALWSPDDLQCSWLITTEIPHATFDIMEDGELYCRGIVIEKADLDASFA